MKDAVQEVAKGLLEPHGFSLGETPSVRGIYHFKRLRGDELVEVVSFIVGKAPRTFLARLGVVRPACDPLDALPSIRGTFDSERRRLGVYSSLGRIVHGDRYFQGRDEYSWETDEQLKSKVRELTLLALEVGPRYWEDSARRMKKGTWLRALWAP